MGLVHFTGLREDVANAGFGDGIKGGVQEAMERLPGECLYWLNGENPTSLAPYAIADFANERIVVDVIDEDVLGGRPALGVWIPPKGTEISSTENSTIFEYNNTTYEIFHKTQPFYRKTA